jgi:hypothetical protein
VSTVDRRIFAVAFACTAPLSAQSHTAVAEPFAQQMAPVLDRVAAMKPQEKYTQKTITDLDRLLMIANLGGPRLGSTQLTK